MIVGTRQPEYRPTMPPTARPRNRETAQPRQELILFIGLPAAGKSTYYREHFAATHVHVSKDLMPKTRRSDARQMMEIEAALAEGKSVVVDNTNPSIDVRAPLIALGRRYGARIIGCYFDVEAKTALVRNRLREGVERVPDVAIFATRKKLVPPSIEEGLDEVVVVKT
jgi:predicted kinase